MRLRKLRREVVRMGIAASMPCVSLLVASAIGAVRQRANNQTPLQAIRHDLDRDFVEATIVALGPVGLLSYALPRLLVRRPKP